MKPTLLVAVVTAAALAPVRARPQVSATGTTRKPLDVIYVPTPPEVVSEMLKVADVKPGDVVYDLGSGDGRIVISAVKDFGATRGVGIDLDPARTAEAAANARAAGVADRVTDSRKTCSSRTSTTDSLIHFWRVPQL